MGDMKTPDFDDLLAAFDIPDATGLDAKEAIQESHDEPESHLKHTGICMDDNVSLPHSVCATDVPAVSVIVKNTSRQESFESVAEKDNPHFGNVLQNGFRSAGGPLDTHHAGHSSFSKVDSSSTNGDCSKNPLEKGPSQYKAERLSSFAKSLPQFSPISSPESEDMQTNGVTDGPKQTEAPYFPSGSIFAPADTPVPDNQRRKQPYCLVDQCHDRDALNETVNVMKTGNMSDREGIKFDCSVQDLRNPTSVCDAIDVPVKNHQNNIGEKNKHPVSETNTSLSRKSVKTPTSKLSSCLEALEALNARKDSNDVISREVSMPLHETVKVSPKVPISPRSPRSPLEVVKQRLIKQPDSPMSICSDSSGKASPALAPSSSPAIPRVRIKTIKTSSGQIKRTVTSVLPDSEAEDLNSSIEWSPAPSSIEESSSKTTPVHRSPDVTGDIIFDSEKNCSPRASSTVARPAKSKTSVNSKKASLSQTPGGSVRRTTQGQKQRKASSGQTGAAPSTGFLPKALHLANLNLVPHSVAASVTARSSSQRQGQSQLSSSVVCSGVPLVHQVKKAAPNSRAVLPNTAAMTLNRLLNYSNPVPTYVPNLNPPPECNISLPAHGYSCAECGDSFGLQKSLAGHYGRKSVHIEVTCTHCAKTLVFHNKCALLAHAREHKNKGIVMQCTQLFMKPIPVDQMFSPSTTERSLPASSPAPSAQSVRSQPVMPLYPDRIIRHGLKCLECNKQMSDYRALAGHYQRLSDESGGLTCKVCSMLLPNKCSFRAHQRIHNHKSPFCCPECGALSRSVDIQKHVKENCLHYCRKVGYKCIHCEMLYVSFTVLKSHIEEKHCEVFYKCTTCPVAFKTSDGCVTHIKNKHDDSTLSPQIIYKCCCETVFKKKQLLFQHFSQRAKKLPTCVFKCPECTTFFMQKQLLVQHFKEVHGGVYRGEAAKSTKQAESSSQRQEAPVAAQQQQPQPQTRVSLPSDGGVKRANMPSRKPSTTTVVSMKNAGWTCGECLLWLPDRDTYVTHMKASHGKSVKRHPCRQCDRSFNSSMSLRRHIRNDHDGKKKVYTCWYCTDEKPTFTKHFMLKNHISLMHGIKNPDFSQMSKVMPQEPNRPSREAAKRSAEEMQGEGSISPQPDGSSAKRPKPHFRCSKCGFTTHDQGHFLEHIPQHKTHPDTPQCQNCGLCFTSQLALSRHLFIVHKVKEPENEREHEEEEDEEDEEEAKKMQNHKPEKKIPEVHSAEKPSERAAISAPSEEGRTSTVSWEPTRLQCNKCSETFDEESSYRVHIQIHEKTNTSSTDGANEH